MGKNVHILGICGTFMGSLAVLAREMGFAVSGSDENVYPPMSTQLKLAGIQLYDGYQSTNLNSNPDQVIVGNAMTRGQDIIEYMLNEGFNYTSGPQWLSENILSKRWVLAVSGTHGKTTTSSLLAWILEYAGLAPGFLIGGVPLNFGCSARLGQSDYFIIEADEYDTAFFDKRSKFVHYYPKTLIINNIEFDHADIFPDIESIYLQFHHLVRCVPGSGTIITPDADESIDKVLAMGSWTPVQRFSINENDSFWHVSFPAKDGSSFILNDPSGNSVEINWEIKGNHNIQNAVGAAVAASHTGVPFETIAAAISKFKGVKRRLELISGNGDILIYDDFAHHPTAIASTIETLKFSYPRNRILALIELRSNTMRNGVHGDKLIASAKSSDAVFWYNPAGEFPGGMPDSTKSSVHSEFYFEVDDLVSAVYKQVSKGDILVFMSNGDFDQAIDRLLERLQI